MHVSVTSGIDDSSYMVSLGSACGSQYSSMGSKKAWLITFASSILFKSSIPSACIWLMTFPVRKIFPPSRFTSLHHTFGFSSFVCSTLVL